MKEFDPTEWAQGLLTGLEDQGFGELDPSFANALLEAAAEMAERIFDWLENC